MDRADAGPGIENLLICGKIILLLGFGLRNSFISDMSYCATADQKMLSFCNCYPTLYWPVIGLPLTLFFLVPVFHSITKTL